MTLPRADRGLVASDPNIHSPPPRVAMTTSPAPSLPAVSTRATPSLTHVIVQVLLIAAAMAAGWWTLQRLASVIVLLTLAALFAYVIAPLVQLAQHPIRLAGRRRHLPRGLAIALVYLLLAGGASLQAVVLLPSAVEQAHEMLARAPAYAQSAIAWEHGWSRYYERLRIPAALRQSIDQSTLDASDAAFGHARAALIAVVGAGLPWIVLVPILAFFLLKDATIFRRTIVTALPHALRLRGHRLFEDLNAALAAYIRAQVLACLLVGGVCVLGFAMLGVPYPVLLGVLAGVLEFIPLVGPLLLAVLAATVSAFHAPILAVWAVTFLGVLRIVEDYVVYPRLMRRGVQLHPLAVITAVLSGAALGGVGGMFFAVPVTAMAAVLVRHWIGWRSEHALEPEASP
jgi:predicted PurR-regulated permease PerM